MIRTSPPRFSRLLPARPQLILPLLLAGLAPLPLQAQDSAPEVATEPRAETAAETALAPLPSMAEIEQAWQRGDTTAVRAGLQRLAEETGTALAEYRYGRVLAEGRGGPRDLPAAIGWLERAVAQNHAEAATLLAQILLAGGADGESRDAARAADLLARAATRGDAGAQLLLAQLLRAGDGVAADPRAAFNWLLAAAEQGRAEAQYALALAYDRGEGTAPTPAEALRWLTEAAASGHVLAQFVLGDRLERGPEAERNLAEARRWYRSAAEAGLPIAQRALGMVYLAGLGGAQDAAEAERWLVRAAEAGDPGAMYNLGLAHLSGKGLAQDTAQARHWLAAAAATGLPQAATTLAGLLETGLLETEQQGTGQAETGQEESADMDRALALYRGAAEQGYAPAARRLAQLAVSGALYGRLAPQRALPWVQAAAREDLPGARDWLRARADEGMRGAQLALAELLLERAGELGADGLADGAVAGSAGDPAGRSTAEAEAIALLTRAAEAGEAQARALLGEAYATGSHGVAQDYVQAHGWYNLAASGGIAGAEARRDLLAQLMTPEQIAEAQAMARAVHAAEPVPPSAGQTVRRGE